MVASRFYQDLEYGGLGEDTHGPNGHGMESMDADVCMYMLYLDLSPSTLTSDGQRLGIRIK